MVKYIGYQEGTMDIMMVSLAVFLASAAGVVFLRSRKRKEVEAQFVITGTVLLLFYIICFFSAVCTILNFMFRWIL